jgi:hypothetical protein
MKKILVVFLLLPFAGLMAFDERGAIANLRALPVEYRQGVMKLSADDADPNPDLWYLTVRSNAPEGGMHELTMASGQVISDKPSLGIRQIFSNASPIDIERVEVDSTEIFNIAQGHAAAAGKVIGSVSFALKQAGSATVPLWSVWCYAPDGSYQGEMEFLASDGSLISNSAFSNRP